MTDPKDPIVELEKKRDVAHGSWTWLTKKRDDLREKIVKLEADIEAAWYKVVELDNQIEAAKADAEAKVVRLDHARSKT